MSDLILLIDDDQSLRRVTEYNLTAKGFNVVTAASGKEGLEYFKDISPDLVVSDVKLSNQKMNAYLKEIADVCGINKELTFHIARHTFATTVTLSNGVPIETVSKMLGHTNLKTTQHYAKILDIKISNDMMLLKEKFWFS